MMRQKREEEEGVSLFEMESTKLGLSLQLSLGV